jgi:flagellar basal-body rod protein FlgB
VEETVSLITDVLGYTLDALGQAQQVAAGNVANDQTPGYTAKTYDFETSLQAALAAGGTVTLAPSEGLSPAPPASNGNNVDLASELVKLSEYQLQSQAVSQALSSHFQVIADSVAASGGGTL